MTKWNAITLYDNDERTYYRETLSWKNGIEHLIELLEEFGDNETYKQSKLLKKEYKKVKRLTKKEMERLLSLTDNCYLDYELH
tara:strand:+ start:197 stop:445 length:249 start_codon:yes stop_codon:yes gene_type:complete